MENFKVRFDNFLMEKLSIGYAEIKLETKFSDLGVDSLDMVELLIEFEKAFNIIITDEDSERIVTIGDAEQYIRVKLKDGFG
ncbi:MAG: acyl carrier protein [Bacteroidota bacterium]|jgi:acyl carrier protein